MKIVEYKVLVVQNHILKMDGSSLALVVNKAVAEGWQPIGGLATQGNLLLQAMVKYGD